MTTEFDSKESAKATACMYAGVGIEALNGVVPTIENKYHPLDDERLYPEEIEVYKIKNVNGKDVEFAIGHFRSGYDLWLIAKNGMMMRV